MATKTGADGGKEWDGRAVVTSAERLLASGGSEARREIVRTTLALQRLLQEA